MVVETAVYGRVSTEKQNVEQQMALLRDYCRRNNLKYRGFVDVGVSGKSADRTAWNKLLVGCERGVFKTILVQRTDRITRRLTDALVFWDFLTLHDVQLVTLYEGVFDYRNADHYFNFMLRCLLSEKELLDLAYRRQVGIERAKREGKYLGGKVGRKRWRKK